MPPLTDSDPVVGALIYAIRVGLWVESDFDRFLSPRGVTLMQFNLMRILYRDPENLGLPTGVLGQQMMTRVPDVPRLLDRLVKSGFIERSASPTDRRIVIVRLTQKGIDLIDNIMEDVFELCGKRTAHMTRAELVTLHGLLKKLHAGLTRDDG